MRTGLGGQKVVLDGGAFVLPIVHDVIPVNMNTLRLEVTRGRDKGAAERISHGTAQVVGADHSWGTQVGARHPVKLTVDFAGGRYTRSLLVPGHIDFKPGEVISVTYAPSDPANFVPVG